MSSKVHFYIRHNRPSKDGSAPIYMLFLINRKQRLNISFGKLIPLKKEFRKLTPQQIKALSAEEREKLYCWDHNKERAIKGAENWESINNFLDNEKARANQVIHKLEMLNKPLTLQAFEKIFLKPKATDNFKGILLRSLKADWTCLPIILIGDIWVCFPKSLFSGQILCSAM